MKFRLMGIFVLCLFTGCGENADEGTVDLSSPVSTIESMGAALRSGDSGRYTLCFMPDQRRAVNLTLVSQDLRNDVVSIDFLQGRVRRVKDNEKHRDRVDTAFYVCELTHEGYNVRIPFVIVYQDGQYLVDRPVLYFYDKSSYFPVVAKAPLSSP